jgi:hypothetical protein
MFFSYSTKHYEYNEMNEHIHWLCFIGIISILCIMVVIDLLYHLWRFGISMTPSSKRARETLIKVLNQHQIIPNEQGKIYDLGAGLGGLGLTLVITFQCSVLAYEKAYTPYYLGRFYTCIYLNLYRKWLRFKMDTSQINIDRLQIIWHQRDIVDALKDYEINGLYLTYLCPEQMQRLSTLFRLLQQNKPKDSIKKYPTNHKADQMSKPQLNSIYNTQNDDSHWIEGSINSSLDSSLDSSLGICVVSLLFALPDFDARYQYNVPNLYRDPIYIYYL